ncbi:MAG: ATP synthase F1 subunit epsilon [Myxococcota bacterium]|nr:ATP synthase F1 subunit epsilon [Myxococcota bacterium]
MPIELVVVTPEGEAFSGPAEEVVLPGVEGEFGVLEAHERFLSALAHGCMEIRTLEGSQVSVVSDGFAEVGPERVVVMVDRHVPKHEIDVAAARSAVESATAELERIGSADDPKKAELEKALARANAEVEVAEKA